MTGPCREKDASVLSVLAISKLEVEIPYASVDMALVVLYGSWNQPMLRGFRGSCTIPPHMPPIKLRAKHEKVLRRLLGELAAHRFLLLFLCMLAYIVVYPYTEDRGSGSYAFRALSALVLGLSVYAVSFRGGIAAVALVLAVPALKQRLLPGAAAGFLPIFNELLSVAFDAWIVVSVFRRVFTKAKITSETIFGALCIYLLNGLTFTGIYGLLHDLQPKAFFLDPAVNLHSVPDRFDLIFYSFGMMTQLGAAGITAVTDQARSLSLIEAILGQLYLAVLISRLIGAYRMPSPPEEDSSLISLPEEQARR